jgi:hypothetical protein
MTATNVNNPTSPVSPISPLNPNSVLAPAPVPSVIEPPPVITAEAPTVKEVQSTTTTSVTEVSKTEIKTDTPKGKEIVPGFGIVMSMQLLNQGYNMQQQQIQEAISLEQENEYGRTQEFTLSLLSETAVGDRFNTINRNRWASLLRNYPLQRLELYDRRSQEDE